MTDIVERLRPLAGLDAYYAEALAEIERLRADIEYARARIDKLEDEIERLRDDNAAMALTNGRRLDEIERLQGELFKKDFPALDVEEEPPNEDGADQLRKHVFK